MKQARAQAESVRGKLIKFFKQNPNPNDAAIHALADQLGKSPHDVETEIYALLTWYMSGDFLKHGDDPDENFDPKELAMGVKVEMEHTNDPAIAKKIAKAHLAEISDYYTWLLKMEQQAKAKVVLLASLKMGQCVRIKAASVQVTVHRFDAKGSPLSAPRTYNMPSIDAAKRLLETVDMSGKDYAEMRDGRQKWVFRQGELKPIGRSAVKTM